MQIILQNVLASLDGSTLNSLAKDISKEFKNTKVTVGSSLAQLDVETVFQSNFDVNGNQWNSPKLLESLLEKFNPVPDTKILVIFNADAYSYGLNFVFGEAFTNGRIAAIYLPRIKQEFYGLGVRNPILLSSPPINSRPRTGRNKRWSSRTRLNFSHTSKKKPTAFSVYL